MILNRRRMLTLAGASAAGAVASTVSKPKAAMAAVTAPTKVRLMSANFRLSPEPDEEIAAGHGWANRKQLTIDLIKAWQPTVIMGQECSTNIRNDLDAAFATWDFVRNGNVIVWYTTNIHTLISSQIYNLPSPPPAPGTVLDPRRLVLAKFQVKATGKYWWAASTHFTGNTPDQADWQAQQMEASLDFIASHGDKANTIFGGDFNNGENDSGSPRGIGRDGGMYDLRSKLAAPRINNVDSNTFNGWNTPPQNGRWVDDIFTGENFQPYYARVIDTNGASDHQFLLVSSIQLT